jgi:hypothetical protein
MYLKNINFQKSVKLFKDKLNHFILKKYYIIINKNNINKINLISKIKKIKKIKVNVD